MTRAPLLVAVFLVVTPACEDTDAGRAWLRVAPGHAAA